MEEQATLMIKVEIWKNEEKIKSTSYLEWTLGASDVKFLAKSVVESLVEEILNYEWKIKEELKDANWAEEAIDRWKDDIYALASVALDGMRQ